MSEEPKTFAGSTDDAIIVMLAVIFIPLIAAHLIAVYSIH